ncbi:acyl-CoA dehydrogenase [Streptomyces sp. NPDC004787]|uniref:acyl-CoA dehydrogenase n=1 Tax=Streptomyces sp. NPDC004787 TaxID=3154291 RepID=UPI0033BCBE78
MRTPKKSAPRPASAPAGVLPADRRADDAIWPRVTREVADDLAVDAVARDRAGGAPYDEAARLQEAGLPALLAAPGPLGRGAWRTACAVVREISAADGSVGELLAHHCVLAWAPRLLGAPAGPLSLDSRAAEERWLLAGAVEPPRPEHGRPGLTLVPTGGRGHLLDGRGAFASGVTVADRLVVGARCTETGDLLLVLVDPAHPAVTVEPSADRVGQRLSGAGTVAFDRLPVKAGQVLGTLPRDEHAIAPSATLAPLALRLLLVHVALGIAEGALAEARDVSRAGKAAAPHGTDPAAHDDPYLLRAYGELATSAHTAAAVVERATDALGRGLHAERLLGFEERSDIAVLVAAAETVAHRAALDITARVLQLVDPVTAADPHGPAPGFDRFWRNTRALTSPVPSDHRLRDIGDHYLNGTHARLTLPA